MGSSHVCKWNEPNGLASFYDNNFNYCSSNSYKSLQLDFNLWRGNIQLSLPMLFSLGFIVTFLNGGLTGLFLGNVTVDVPLSDTYFVVAHFHMVMGIAPILVVFGAIYHWYPLITGRLMNETLGKVHFWITFIGSYAIYFPMHYQGFVGVPRRYYEIYDSPYIDVSTLLLNKFITIAVLIVGAAQLLFLYNLFASARLGKKAEKNPWKANSLEWQTLKCLQNMVIGARNFQKFTDGLTILVYLEQKKGLHTTKTNLQVKL